MDLLNEQKDQTSVQNMETGINELQNKLKQVYEYKTYDLFDYDLYFKNNLIYDPDGKKNKKLPVSKKIQKVQLISDQVKNSNSQEFFLMEQQNQVVQEFKKQDDQQEQEDFFIQNEQILELIANEAKQGFYEQISLLEYDENKSETKILIQRKRLNLGLKLNIFDQDVWNEQRLKDLLFTHDDEQIQSQVQFILNEIVQKSIVRYLKSQIRIGQDYQALIPDCAETEEEYKNIKSKVGIPQFQLENQNSYLGEICVWKSKFYFQNQSQFIQCFNTLQNFYGNTRNEEELCNLIQQNGHQYLRFEDFIYQNKFLLVKLFNANDFKRETYQRKLRSIEYHKRRNKKKKPIKVTYMLR